MIRKWTKEELNEVVDFLVGSDRKDFKVLIDPVTNQIKIVIRPVQPRVITLDNGDLMVTETPEAQY